MVCLWITTIQNNAGMQAFLPCRGSVASHRPVFVRRKQHMVFKIYLVFQFGSFANPNIRTSPFIRLWRGLRWAFPFFLLQTSTIDHQSRSKIYFLQFDIFRFLYFCHESQIFHSHEFVLVGFTTISTLNAVFPKNIFLFKRSLCSTTHESVKFWHLWFGWFEHQWHLLDQFFDYNCAS